MKVLILIRHAKSSQDDTSVPDKQRPLNKRGLRDAPAMGKRLAKRSIKPDLVLSSPATRALTTAQIIAEKIGYPPESIVQNERLYATPAEELLAVVQELDNAVQQVMLFGHNPGLTDLVHRLSSGEIDDIPTCGVVLLTFDTKAWSDIGTDGLAKVEFDSPKSR